MDEKDYYAILGLPRSAGRNEIKRRFRELAQRHRPDINPDVDHEKWTEIVEAYEWLSNPQEQARSGRERSESRRAPDRSAAEHAAKVQAARARRKREREEVRANEAQHTQQGPKTQPAWDSLPSWEPFPPRPRAASATPSSASTRAAATPESVATWHDVADSFPIYLGVLLVCSLPALIMGPLGLIGAANHHHPIAGLLMPVFGLGFLIGIAAAFWATLWFFAQVWEALKGP